MKDESCGCTRREVIQWGARTGIGFTFGQILGLTSLFAQPASRARACVLLWMTGGPSQIDTFDPKSGQLTGGEFKSIATSIPGIHVAEHLPSIAREMKDLAIIRSMTSREGNHDRARYYVHTGYVPTGVTQHPGIGSIVAKELMDQSGSLPVYVSLNGPGISSGLLGVNFAPFVIRDSLRPLDHLQYADSVSQERFNSRLAMMNSLNSGFDATHGQQEFAQKERIYERAVELMHSPALSAFDVTQERESVRSAYGKGKFGAACLMARRLVQNGVKFVEVEMDGWDTHTDNFDRTRQLCTELDPAFAALVRDLRQTGLLNSTLVVWMGEFGRTPQINSNAGRDHWPQAWSAVLAGAGIKGGQVVGSTTSNGMEVKDNPVTVPDLYATLCKCLSIDDSKYNSSPLGRPIRLTDHGKVIPSLV